MVIRRLWWASRCAAAVAVAVRLARAARRPPPLAAPPTTGVNAHATISVVVPARDEEHRLAPLLEVLAADTTVSEVIVVDDESSDGTAALARGLGATVLSGRPLPSGWVGKPWALDQGLRAASGDWVVSLDADVEPSPGLALALVDRLRTEGLDMASVAGRFECPTAPLRALHPAFLTTLIYRFGPPGRSPRRPARVLANGQCTVVRRAELLGAGGYSAAAGHLTDDVALARSLVARGWRIALLDGTAVLRVRMHTSARDAWCAWGRSLPMPDVTSVVTRIADAFTLLVTQALPLPRLLLRQADALDVALLAMRAGTLAGTARAYERTDLAYWLSPLADPAAVLRVLWGAVRPGRSWRGRTYSRSDLSRSAPPLAMARRSA
jgi:dolichol-phosphate mannosyltransferase